VALRSGQTLVHFRLVDKIGEGGMGEVWRAVDTTLDREVAIKILPASVAGDRDRIARFEREAKLLASLNHPNIAAIYGFPEADAGGEKLRFLAMELVRGDDLAQVLSRGPLPVREAIDAAKQIAAALEAAHDAGVVHRDLKPANVKRTPEGQTKVLDFGLAKTLGTAGASPALSATVTSTGSVAGLIVGTACYMSPEQARGLPVDRRTDLWAFGCVLFEMLSGAKAFDGATVTDVLAAVVTGEPDWSKLPAATPPAVRRLLRRCLEKDARKRLRDAGDASLLLDENPEDARAGAPSAAPARSAKVGPIAAAALVALLLGIGGGLLLRSRAVPEFPGVEFHRLTFARGLMLNARFAPDGRTIVYGAGWGGPPTKLYLSRTEGAETTPIAAPPAEILSISRSGELLISLGHAYYGWMGDGTLARTSLLGGAPREILEHVRAADWSPDGADLAIVRRVADWDQLEYPVGTVLDRTIGYFGDVRVSPDGSRVAYTDHPSWGDNRGGVSLVDRAGKKTVLAEGFGSVQGVAWSPDGEEVWFTSQTEHEGNRLHAVEPGGRTRIVYASIGLVQLFDVAPDGRVLMGRHQGQREVLALLRGFEEPRPLVVAGETSLARGISGDGTAVLVSNHAPNEYETFVVRSDRPGAVRLSAGDGVAISPDGASALTTSSDYRTVYVTPLGMGPTREVPNPDGIEYSGLPAWHPDGKRILSVGRKGSEAPRGFVLDLATGAARPFAEAGVTWQPYIQPPVSPDGRYAVLHDAAGTPKRWPIEGGAGLAIQGALPEDEPLTFTEDGTALFVAGRTLPVAIERIDLATGRRTPWITVAPTDRAGLRYSVAAITPSGRYWALSTAKLLTDLYVVEGLR
jgi:sugar lactone lactonase YvrE